MNTCNKCCRKFTCRYAEENKNGCDQFIGDLKMKQDEIKKDIKTIRKVEESL